MMVKTAMDGSLHHPLSELRAHFDLSEHAFALFPYFASFFRL